MGISLAVVRVVAICFGLIVGGHASFAIGQQQPQSPTDLVRELNDKLRTCPRDGRDNLLIEFLDYFLGPDGKPMIPTLFGVLEDTPPPPKQYSFGFSRPSRELTEQEIRDQEAVTILEVIASFGREGVEPLLQTLKSKDASTRAYAAIGLGRIGAAAESLLSFGNDAKPDLKKLRELEDSEYASVRQPVKAAIAALNDQ